MANGKRLVGLGGQPLRFGFAIFNEDSPTVTCFIEYDGEFHYHKFFEEQNLDGLKDHDERKNQYCEENNIPLLRIPYWEFDNIEEVLKEWFEQIKEANVIWQN